MQIVVARYNEDVTWTKQFPNVIIYNKGEPLGEDYNEHFLNNVGREGHTYYKHIYENYDTLSDYTIFVQGDPFPHCSHLIELLNKIFDIYNKKSYNQGIFSLSNCIVGCTFTDSKKNQIPLKEVYEYLFGAVNENLSIDFYPGAQFIISREKIHSRPREFYLKIIQLLEYSINPPEGHAIERLHRLILNCTS